MWLSDIDSQFDIQLIMQVLTNINEKLDQGWKITNVNCPKCQVSALAEPATDITQFYCPKCNKSFAKPIIKDQEQNQQIENEGIAKDDEFYDKVINQFQNKPNHSSVDLSNNKDKSSSAQYKGKGQQVLNREQRSNIVSKKIGEKLMLGWTMLNESCSTCNVPLMKSKKNQKICMGCDRDYAQPQQKIQTNNSQSITQENAKGDTLTKQQVSIKEKDKDGVDGNKIYFSMVSKSLSYLNKKLDRAIEQNKIEQIQKLMELARKIHRSNN